MRVIRRHFTTLPVFGGLLILTAVSTAALYQVFSLKTTFKDVMVIMSSSSDEDEDAGEIKRPRNRAIQSLSVYRVK
jgi:hypothetical protein